MRTILVFRSCDAFGQRQNDLWPVQFERPPFTIVLGRLRAFSAQIIQKLANETWTFNVNFRITVQICIVTKRSVKMPSTYQHTLSLTYAFANPISHAHVRIPYLPRARANPISHANARIPAWLTTKSMEATTPVLSPTKRRSKAWWRHMARPSNWKLWVQTPL